MNPPPASTGAPPPSYAVPASRLVELLAPALGTDKSVDLLHATCQQFRYAVEGLDQNQAEQVLLALGKHPGIVGISARLARTRLQSGSKHSSVPRLQLRTRNPKTGDSGRPAPSSVRITPAEVRQLLAQSIGAEKAEATVLEAMDRLAIDEQNLSREQALDVLCHIGKAPGIVGVAARFAMTRLRLRLETR